MRAARRYAQAAMLAREVEARMLERLDYIKLAPQTILDAGCAAGAGLAALAQRYPDAQVLGLDHAWSMLPGIGAQNNWLRRAFKRERTHALCADMQALPLPAASLDLVWSNLVLHCLGDPLPALKEMHRALRVGGLLMFSCYGPDTLKELRAAFSGDARAAHVHDFIDMHDLGDMLAASGYADAVMDMEVVTITYAEVDALLQELKATGQTNVLAQRRRGLTGRGVFSRMRAAYEQLRRDGRIPASFELVYGHAWKPEPRSEEDGRSIVRLDSRLARHLRS